MNQQQAQRLLPIVQAIAEGKRVEYQVHPSVPWVDHDPKNRLALEGEYRVKGEPLRAYVATWFCGVNEQQLGVTSCDSEEYLREHYGGLPGFQITTIEREQP